MVDWDDKAASVFQKVKQIIMEEFKVKDDQVTAGASMKDLYADSADRINLGMRLQDEFDLSDEAEDVDFTEDTTIEDIVGFILKYSRA